LRDERCWRDKGEGCRREGEGAEGAENLCEHGHPIQS